MSRSLKISDEVYEMLTCLKLSPSTSFNDFILWLIEDICPILPLEIRRIRKLMVTDPDSAFSDLDSLQKEVFENCVVEMLIRKKERQEEAAIEQHFKLQEMKERKGE